MQELLGPVRRVKVPREENATAALRQVDSLQLWAASLKKGQLVATRVVAKIYRSFLHSSTLLFPSLRGRAPISQISLTRVSCELQGQGPGQGRWFGLRSPWWLWVTS